MQGLRWLQMTDEEIDALLGRGGTGVISFSSGDEQPPLSIPVSYGYDPDGRVLYFRLSVSPGRRKRAFLDEPVSFVSYGETDDGWRSVVTSGTLEDLSDAPYKSHAIQGMWAIEMPAVDIFEQPREDVDFRDYCLDPERMTGRKEVETEG